MLRVTWQKTHLPVYLWCLFLGAGGQTGTEQAFSNSRQTRTDHACPWLCPRIKKHVWPECSTAEAGKIMGWSQEKQAWLLDAESEQGKVRRAESTVECQVNAFQNEEAAADVWVLQKWTCFDGLCCLWWWNKDSGVLKEPSKCCNCQKKPV